MKKEELMIGDWVALDMNWAEDDPMYSRLDYQPYQIKCGEDFDLAEETNCIGDADAYQPILINDDILSLNGWERTGGASHRIYGDYNAVIFHWNENRKEIIIDKNGERHYMLKLDLLYVHELQHALRICGIDTEIKIKQVEL